MTNKCLVYHNDQWFDFSVPAAGSYYLIISAQQCKRKLGVQAIVIEGNPCKINTYRVLRCIDRIRQDDVYIKLDSLGPGPLYLVNIDGFLGDYCDFRIQLSNRPAGLPLVAEDPGAILPSTRQRGRVVKMEWTVDKERIEDFDRFRVYKSTPPGVRADVIKEQLINRNSYGSPLQHYEAFDSLSLEGIHRYQVFGIHKETQIPFSLLVREITYVREVAYPAQERVIKLQLAYPDKTRLDVVIYDRVNYKTLERLTLDHNLLNGDKLDIDVSEYLDKGIREFMILVSDAGSREDREYYFRVNRFGRLGKE